MSFLSKGFTTTIVLSKETHIFGIFFQFQKFIAIVHMKSDRKKIAKIQNKLRYTLPKMMMKCHPVPRQRRRRKKKKKKQKKKKLKVKRRRRRS